ncbi:MAG: stage II sporulation protein M [Inquilinus sp.]|nr:stage II sporulation protein M [Inquilinus sp.]
MANDLLKSYSFRREREQDWRALEAMVAKTDTGGLKALSADEVMRLPGLYRATISSLSVARSISLDRNVVQFLEGLAVRAYFCVYGTRTGLMEALSAFFGVGFPQAVRDARRSIAVSGFVFALGIFAGFQMTAGNEDWFYTFVGTDMAGGRDPSASTDFLRAVLFDEPDSLESLNLFASFLFSNNARVGMLCFALGFAFGVPVLLLLINNGLMLGAFLALYHGRGLLGDLSGWLLIHGVTELLAVVLCGGAGMLLGQALAFPGRHTRMANLAIQGRLAARIVLGAVAMFFLAALLEGFGRQLINDTGTRALVAGTTAVLWAFYFIRVGRRRRHGDDR